MKTDFLVNQPRFSAQRFQKAGASRPFPFPASQDILSLSPKFGQADTGLLNQAKSELEQLLASMQQNPLKRLLPFILEHPEYSDAVDAILAGNRETVDEIRAIHRRQVREKGITEARIILDAAGEKGYKLDTIKALFEESPQKLAERLADYADSLRSGAKFTENNGVFGGTLSAEEAWEAQIMFKNLHASDYQKADGKRPKAVIIGSVAASTYSYWLILQGWDVDVLTDDRETHEYMKQIREKLPPEIKNHLELPEGPEGIIIKGSDYNYDEADVIHPVSLLPEDERQAILDKIRRSKNASQKKILVCHGRGIGRLKIENPNQDWLDQHFDTVDWIDSPFNTPYDNFTLMPKAR